MHTAFSLSCAKKESKEHSLPYSIFNNFRDLTIVKNRYHPSANRFKMERNVFASEQCDITSIQQFSCR